MDDPLHHGSLEPDTARFLTADTPMFDARDAAECSAYTKLQQRTIAIFNRSQVRIRAAARVTARKAVQAVLLEARARDPQ